MLPLGHPLTLVPNPASVQASLGTMQRRLQISSTPSWDCLAFRRSRHCPRSEQNLWEWYARLRRFFVASALSSARQARPYEATLYVLQDSETASQASDRIRVPDNIFTLNCELCKGGHHEEKIILCDRCDRGCHLFCLSPPLEQVPEGEWLCPLCKAEDAHGFVEGQQYSLDEFEKTATMFKKNFFGGQAAAKKVCTFSICAGLAAATATICKMQHHTSDVPLLFACMTPKACTAVCTL